MSQRRSRRALCLVLFATVEPVVDGVTVTAGEDVKTLKCSLCACTIKQKVKLASMSCLVFHLLQKHNISKESHERSERLAHTSSCPVWVVAPPRF